MCIGGFCSYIATGSGEPGIPRQGGGGGGGRVFFFFGGGGFSPLPRYFDVCDRAISCIPVPYLCFVDLKSLHNSKKIVLLGGGGGGVRVRGVTPKFAANF